MAKPLMPSYDPQSCPTVIHWLHASTALEAAGLIQFSRLRFMRPNPFRAKPLMLNRTRSLLRLRARLFLLIVNAKIAWWGKDIGYGQFAVKFSVWCEDVRSHVFSTGANRGLTGWWVSKFIGGRVFHIKLDKNVPKMFEQKYPRSE